MPDSLATAKVSQEGFQTFATLWRNVHSLAVATDLHYNSMGFFRKADFKVLSPPSALLQHQTLSAGDVHCYVPLIMLRKLQMTSQPVVS